MLLAPTLFTPHNTDMKTLIFLLFLPLLSSSYHSDDHSESLLFPKESTLVNSIIEPSGRSESYFEITPDHSLEFDLNKGAEPIISIVPLLSSHHIDDMGIRILIESTDGCERSVYKLSGSVSNELICDGYPSLNCGEKYQITNQSLPENKTYKISLLSGCDIALIQLRTSALRA